MEQITPYTQEELEAKDWSIEVHGDGGDYVTMDEVLTTLSEEGTQQIDKSRISEALEGYAETSDVYDIFKKQWFVAVGTYGGFDEMTGYYQLNGIVDIDLDEAIRIYEARNYSKGVGTSLFFFGRSSNIRTNLPLDYDTGVACTFQVNRQNSLTVLNLAPYSTYMQGALIWANVPFRPFYFCTVLRRVNGTIDVNAISSASNGYYDVPLLEEISITRLRVSFGFFRGCPNINAASLSFLVSNAVNSSAITVLVHPTTYDKLIDTGNVTWYNILTAATAKNISFATSWQ